MTVPLSRQTRVLMLTHRAPYPPDRGDRIRSFNLLCELAGQATVDLACLAEEPVTEDQRQMLEALTDRLAIVPTSPLAGKVRGLRALARGRAATPAAFYRPMLAKQIVDWHQQRPFDAVLTYCSGMLHYGRFLYGAVTRPPRVHILDLVDVDSVKWAEFAASSRWPMRKVYAAEAKQLQAVEAGRYDHFDAVSVISPREAAVYREHVCDRHRVIVAGNGTDTEYFRPAPHPGGHTLVFVGVLDYLPNVRAVTWFAEAVLPRVRQAMPEARFVVVGRRPTSAVRALADRPGVQIAGSVPDVRPYLAEAATVVAPLAIAPGVQNKVLEAMAAARPVICSPAAAMGLDEDTARHLLLADSAEGFTAHVLDLLGQPVKARALGLEARTHVEQAYSWAGRLEPLVRPLVSAGRPAWITEETNTTPQAA